MAEPKKISVTKGGKEYCPSSSTQVDNPFEGLPCLRDKDGGCCGTCERINRLENNIQHHDTIKSIVSKG